MFMNDDNAFLTIKKQKKASEGWDRLQKIIENFP